MSVSNSKAQKAEPKITNIFGFFQEGVKKYEEKNHHLKLKDNSRRNPYCLYEDLKIIFEFSKKQDTKFNVYKSLTQGDLSHRSEESIRSRYKDYIQDLSSADFTKIFNYVYSRKSIDGYIVKERDENGAETIVVREIPGKPSVQSKVLQVKDKSQLPKRNSKKGQEEIQQEVKLPLKRRQNVPEILINGKKQLKTEGEQQSKLKKKKDDMIDEDNEKEVEDNQEEENQEEQDEEEEKEFKYEKKPASESEKHKNEDENRNKKQKKNKDMEVEIQNVELKLVPPSSSHQQQQAGGQKLSTQLSEVELKDARELDVYIHFLANYDNVQKKSLIHTLDKLSGDFNQLVDYIQTQNNNLLWKEDEDQVLHSFSSQSPQAIYLLKSLKKGKENIVRRAAYLGIQLPDFE